MQPQDPAPNPPLDLSIANGARCLQSTIYEQASVPAAQRCMACGTIFIRRHRCLQLSTAANIPLGRPGLGALRTRLLTRLFQEVWFPGHASHALSTSLFSSLFGGKREVPHVGALGCTPPPRHGLPKDVWRPRAPTWALRGAQPHSPLVRPRVSLLTVGAFASRVWCMWWWGRRVDPCSPKPPHPPTL